MSGVTKIPKHRNPCAKNEASFKGEVHLLTHDFSSKPICFCWLKVAIFFAFGIDESIFQNPLLFLQQSWKLEMRSDLRLASLCNRLIFHFHDYERSLVNSTQLIFGGLKPGSSGVKARNSCWVKIHWHIGD